MTLCKKVASALGGDIEVQSQQGEGSKIKFWIENRLFSEETKENLNNIYFNLIESNSDAQSFISDHNNTPHVLIVDDEPMNLMVIQSYLKGINLIGDEAMNGQEAITKVKEKAKFGKGYRLILMDLNMPIMSGEEASKNIKYLWIQGEIPIVPIIAITAAEETTSLKKQLLDAGICKLVQKPLSKMKFLTIAQEYKLMNN